MDYFMNIKKILGVLVAIAFISLIGYVFFISTNEGEAISVRTTQIGKETIIETLSTTGILEPSQTQEVLGQ